SLVLLIIMIIMGRPVIAGISDDLLLLLYVSIFITGLGYLAYFIAIRYSDATTGSVTFFIKPMIAPIIAALVLGDIILSSTYAGIGLILMASLININENRKLR
ncbi:MAG: EamA family transporter, partial [Eubacteriales bacterium]|nr:EamA family transporter [Eubacteriales bacterium]